MKKLIMMCLVLVLLLPASLVSAASNLKPDSDIKVILEGERLFFDVDPIQTNGTTFVQFTTIFKALGLDYEWLPSTKEVHGYNEEIDLWLTLNDPIAVLNGEIIELPVAPFAYDGRTLVPLRFVSQSTGLQVDWDGPNKVIEIYEKSGLNAPGTKSIVDHVGFAKGPDQTIVQKFYPDLPTDVNDFNIQYDNADFLGYNTQLYYNFVNDELTGADYYYGRYGEKESTLMDVYNDIIDNLRSVYGSPRIDQITTAWQEGVGTEDITMFLLTDSEFLKGVKAGEYEAITEWNAKDGFVNVHLYVTDSGVVNIQVSFYYK